MSAANGGITKIFPIRIKESPHTLPRDKSKSCLFQCGTDALSGSLQWPTEFQVSGHNAAAPFTLKLHRGDGMTLLAMDWKVGKPPQDFVGFAIEYKEPNGDRFYALKNRLGFRAASGQVNPNILSTMLSPIQKFRWVHFPRNADS